MANILLIDQLKDCLRDIAAAKEIGDFALIDKLQDRRSEFIKELVRLDIEITEFKQWDKEIDV